MTLARRLVSDEAGLSRVAWVAAIALAAVLAARHWQQVPALIDWLRDLGQRLAGRAF